MTLAVRVLPRAKADFSSMYHYIEERSPRGAINWRDAFETAVAQVSKAPESGGKAPEDELTNFLLRQKLFKTKYGLAYRFVYTVLDGELLILRVRGPGQPPLLPDEVHTH